MHFRLGGGRSERVHTTSTCSRQVRPLKSSILSSSKENQKRMRASSTRNQRALRQVNLSTKNMGSRSTQNPSTTKSGSRTTQFGSSIVSMKNHGQVRKVGPRVTMMFRPMEGSSHHEYLEPTDDDEYCRVPPQICFSKYFMVQPLGNIRNILRRSSGDAVARQDFTDSVENDGYHIPPPICFSKSFMVEPLPFAE